MESLQSTNISSTEGQQSDISSTENEFFFPKRSTMNTNDLVKVNLAVNYFRFDFTDPTKRVFFKYAVNFTPELPGDSSSLRSRIFGRARPDLQRILGNCVFNNTVLYSLENHPDHIEISVQYKEESYQISIKLTNTIEKDSYEAESLYKKFFNLLVRKMKYIQIRKNHFDPRGKKFLKNDLEVWPGFNSAVNVTNEGALLNMNLVYRIVRPEKAIDLIKNFNNEEDRLSFRGTAVLTRYNNDRVFIIDDIDVSKTPQSSFDTRDGPTTFLDYYQKKYGIKIQRPDQPLLVCRDRKKGTEINLIPELCYLTGLTDDMRSNFNLMKELAVITKGNAADKLKECRALIDGFKDNTECEQAMKDWGIKIDNTPVNLTGYRIRSGNYLMSQRQDGTRNSFSADDSQDIDRRIQTEMYSQPALHTWAIFSTEKDESLTKLFCETMSQIKSTFKFQMNSPRVILVGSNNIRDWETQIMQNTNPNVQAVVLIIPGSRGKGPLYAELKKLLLNRFPIPSQVVLAGTLSKGKGIRSIVNKILIQISAKIGGEPWAISDMPFTKEPTMVCGVDLFKSRDNRQMLGFTATMNSTFTRYVSLTRVTNDTTGCQDLTICVNEAIQHFNNVNRLTPSHIIIIRDGVTPTQIKTRCVQEVLSIKKSLQGMKVVPKLTFSVLNRSTNLKAFQMDLDRVTNAQPGTVISSTVTSRDVNDFYLVPAKTDQGVASSIHYQMVYDDAKVSDKDFQTFVYKLCYLYYNWVGSIKVPAPCQYAKKLVNLIGEKLSDRNTPFQPNPIFADWKFLYYL